MARVGIIGGSGVGQLLGQLGPTEKVLPTTPFGPPSSPLIVGKLGQIEVVLLLRHGEGHVWNPSRVPYRANLWALKSLGVTRVLASTAVGSLHETYRPRQVVLPDQVIDKTFRRETTFFDELAVHTDFAQPFCPQLRSLLQSVPAEGFEVHRSGTYVCMEGPQFSTQAESLWHRSLGAQLIGMTLMPEARLAREAELCYAPVALVTDFDCWKPADHSDPQAVSKTIWENLQAASANGMKLLLAALQRMGEQQALCSCQRSLETAVWTAKDRIPAELKTRLALLLGKYL